MDHYKALNLKTFAAAEDVKKSYRRLAMLYHPDRSAGDKAKEEKFKIINTAYQILGEPSKKKAYDQELRLSSVNGTVNSSVGSNDAVNDKRANTTYKPQPVKIYTAEGRKRIIEEHYPGVMASIATGIELRVVYDYYNMASYQVTFEEFISVLKDLHDKREAEHARLVKEHRATVAFIPQKFVFLTTLIMCLVVIFTKNYYNVVNNTTLLASCIWFSTGLAAANLLFSYFFKKNRYLHLSWVLIFLGFTAYYLYHYNIIAIYSYLKG